MSSLERGPGLELSHGGQGELQQLSQGWVVGVCVEPWDNSLGRHGIGTKCLDAWSY